MHLNIKKFQRVEEANISSHILPQRLPYFLGKTPSTEYFKLSDVHIDLALCSFAMSLFHYHYDVVNYFS